MANTVVFNIASQAFPSLANDLKYVIYLQSAPTVEVDSHTFPPAHPARTVSFPGLLRDNYKFKLLVMSGVTVLAEKASIDFVPDNGDINAKAPVEIEVDMTPGIAGGTTSFVFDGTGGTEDWRGYEIYVERVGQGTMRRDVQYSWNKITGTFTLLTVGDVFQPQELFNVEFGLIISSSSSVPAIKSFGDTMVVTGTTVLTSADIGKKIIIEGASSAFDITLPDITTFQDSIVTYFEAGIGSHKCVRLITTSGQVIKWLKGSRTDLKMGVCEDLALYKQKATNIWRVHQANGNFAKVGRIITTDAEIADEFNCVEMDGSSLNVNDYLRLYEDYVLQLPAGEVVAFTNWAIGDNKYKWSFASGGVFKCPDRRYVYLRNWDGTKLPGLYEVGSVGPHKHLMKGSFTQGGYDGGGNDFYRARSSNPFEEHGIMDTTGTGITLETKPNSVIVRQFVLT